MSFRFSAPCPYLLDDIKFCFHLNPIFQLLSSKTGTMKKIKTLKKMADNSEPVPSKKKRYCMKFYNSLRNLGQVKVLLYVLCVEAISVLHMEEKMLIDTRTPQSTRDMWILCKDKILTDFGASSMTANLDQKVVKAKLLFSAFWLNTSSL